MTLQCFVYTDGSTRQQDGYVRDFSHVFVCMKGVLLDLYAPRFIEANLLARVPFLYIAARVEGSPPQSTRT